MKIEAIRAGGSAVVHLQGRLDRECAEELADTLDDLLQRGVRSVNLDFGGVTYLSSPAIGVLAGCQERLAVLRGQVRLVSIPPAVREALAVTGWDPGSATEGSGMITSSTDLRRSAWQTRLDLATSGQYETAAATRQGTLSCKLHGDPAGLTRAPIQSADCAVVSFPEGVFGLGIGAIGRSYEECHPRMGELIAVGGCVAYFPTDGARRADYLVSAGAEAPAAVLASGLTLEGQFSQIIRFGTRPETESIPLAELAGVALEASGAKTAAVVIAAETATLHGTKLLRSPADPAGPMRFEIPAVHDWLEFAPEPSRAMTTTLIVGVLASAPQGPLASHLRPLGEGGKLFAHLHAAVFSYHPLPQRTVEFTPLIKETFANHQLNDVLHLIWDDRGEAGVGDTAVVRGVTWIGPVTRVD